LGYSSIRTIGEGRNREREGKSVKRVLASKILKARGITSREVKRARSSRKGKKKEKKGEGRGEKGERKRGKGGKRKPASKKLQTAQEWRCKNSTFRKKRDG